MSTTHDVFISYSQKNKSFADRLRGDLEDHHITVWLDRLEIAPGDRPRQKIESAIESSRYFCLIISDAAMKSYYVRQLELEAAFTRMIQSRSQAFILPVLLQRPKVDLPLMLASLQYADFSTASRYRNNLQQLVKRIKLGTETFTGARWYKNVDTSLLGTMVGVGPLNRAPMRGTCVRVFYQDGVIRTLETFNDRHRDGAKSISYDERSRVSEIVLFRDSAVVDTWRYEYDPVDGQRAYKYIYNPGEKPHTILEYDKRGNRTSEKYFRQDGSPDGSRGYVAREWQYNKDGEMVGELRIDIDGSRSKGPASGI